MRDTAGGRFFIVLRVLSYVALAAMVAAGTYAAVLIVRYWPGIAV